MDLASLQSVRDFAEQYKGPVACCSDLLSPSNGYGPGGICGPKPRMCWCTMPLFWVLETSSVLRTVDAADPWFLKTVIVT